VLFYTFREFIEELKVFAKIENGKMLFVFSRAKRLGQRRVPRPIICQYFVAILPV
jgi:hypothetical protein